MSTSSSEEQIASLQKELAKIENNLHIRGNPIRLQRATLQQELNVLRSPIYRLSTELMVAIFHYTLPPPLSFEFDLPRTAHDLFFPPEIGDLFFPIILSAVSARWRDVASSTPSLWTHFQFPAYLWSHENPPHSTIDIYLTNSKDLPLQLDLAFPLRVQPTKENHFFHRKFDRLLSLNLSRIKRITLKNPPSRWLYQVERLSSAIDISVQWDRAMSTEMHMENPRFERCRSLSRLAIRNSIMESSSQDPRVLYQVPCSLTILDLSAIQVDHCIKVALRCPWLIELYIRYSIHADEDPDAESVKLWFGNRVTFRRLEVLYFGPIIGPWESAFLAKLHTPVLREFTISNQLNGLTIRDPEDGFGQFVDRLPPTFSRLEVEDCEFIEVDCCGCLFDHRSSIQEVKFVDCEIDSIIRLLEDLQLSEEQVNMPNLRAISVCGGIQEILQPMRAHQRMSEVEPMILNHFVTTLESRLVEGSNFRLEFSRIAVDWTPVLQARLRALVQRGARIQVVEDGDIVDWL
ncbi:hypothetical protein NP233_g5611 [Leucocoprinus birnbaumii]|uniref:F-box domain-containing protein n=1 Tax=Leucocoprinus birnbaumii TaxID=56174 RepID=A0AAD5VW09_9AGAR|nr:hypothetical protein NP233_g5611 [Leucocoprinus birnbaumii]